ncbi:MAG: CHAT domain-containing protein [Candidatus Anammoximicrobium sp.]|nr:CHAT domain-containing protein [Candidatus Anammoximicrobium sp.]
MVPTLQLTLTDYADPAHWRWVLNDARGKFLADHDVRLDAASRGYRGFLDLAQYLDYRKPIQDVEEQLAELSDWIGRHVFGGLLKALWDHRALPAVAVYMSVPATAQQLLFRPFELARFQDGTTFRQAGVRFVYQLDGAARPGAGSKAVGAETSLRILAGFSLPVKLNPLNLRRERYALQRLVRELGQTRGAAVELRVLQYGATRDTLRAALEEADGWDVVHLSGQGERGELLLEDDRGGTDTIDADELGVLLERAGRRLKLLILDTCCSGAASHAAARVQIGLDRLPVRQEGAAGQALAETAQTVLPSLAQSLAERLHCAALAIRYPVGDAFATELMLALYEKLLDRHAEGRFQGYVWYRGPEADSDIAVELFNVLLDIPSCWSLPTAWLRTRRCWPRGCRLRRMNCRSAARCWTPSLRWAASAKARHDKRTRISCGPCKAGPAAPPAG